MPGHLLLPLGDCCCRTRRNASEAIASHGDANTLLVDWLNPLPLFLGILIRDRRKSALACDSDRTALWNELIARVVDRKCKTALSRCDRVFGVPVVRNHLGIGLSHRSSAAPDEQAHNHDGK